MKRVLALAVGAAVALGFIGAIALTSVGLLLPANLITPSADASDHVVPRVTLHHGNKVQRGLLWSSSWTHPVGPDMCVATIGDGIPTFGPALHVGSDDPRLRIRFHKSQRPRVLRITASLASDADDLPADRRRNLPRRLVKERHHGHLQWVAAIRPRVDSDLHINVLARWKDTEGCSGDDQYGSWTFHVAP